MSPRDRFQQSESKAKAADQLLSSQIFEDASDAAMLQMMSVLTGGGNDAATAMANHYRLDGARRYMDILKTIAKPQVIEPPKDLDNLKPV